MAGDQEYGKHCEMIAISKAEKKDGKNICAPSSIQFIGE